MRARHRLSKFLLRHEIRFEGPGNNWTQRHLAWLAKLEFSDPAAHATFEDYRGGVEVMLHRRTELERSIEGMIPDSPWTAEVARFRCLRGIDFGAQIGPETEFAPSARLDP